MFVSYNNEKIKEMAMKRFNSMSFPGLLTNFRKILEMTQQKFADETGLSRSVISNVEIGSPLHPDAFKEVKRVFSKSGKISDELIKLLEEKYDKQLVKMAKNEKNTSWIAELYVNEHRGKNGRQLSK